MLALRLAETDALASYLDGPNDKLGALLDDFHGREILHVTYGSVLNHPRLGADLFAILQAHEGLYTKLIAQHFDRHLQLF